MTKNAWVWMAVILASTALAVLAIAGLFPEPMRSASMFWFLLICPGLAFVPLFQFGPPALELVIALGVSIALNTLVTLVLVLFGAWSMEAALLIMIGTVIIGIFTQLAQHWAVASRRLRQPSVTELRGKQ